MPFTTGEPVPITPADVKYADTWALDMLEVRVSVPSAMAQFAVFCKGEQIDTVRGVVAGADLEKDAEIVALFAQLEMVAFRLMQALGKVPAEAKPVLTASPEPPPGGGEPVEVPESEEVNDGAGE